MLSFHRLKMQRIIKKAVKFVKTGKDMQLSRIFPIVK